MANVIECIVKNQREDLITVVTVGDFSIVTRDITSDEALKCAENLRKCAMEIKERENKAVTKAINTIKNFCYEHNCESCFLGRDEFDNRVCKLGKITPEYWRLDE